MSTNRILSRRLSIYKFHEYERWLSEMEASGWKLYKFKNRKQLEFKANNSACKKFIFLETSFGKKFYMMDIEHSIDVKYKHTKFSVPTISGDIVLLYRLEIEQVEYNKLVRYRDKKMLTILYQKIGMPLFLSLLLIVFLFVNFNIIAMIILAGNLIFCSYYSLCFYKFKKLSKYFGK